MARHRLGQSGDRNTLYSRNPISKVPSYWEVVSLLGGCNAFKNKAGEREREGGRRRRITWVVPGHFWDRRAQSLALGRRLGMHGDGGVK